MSCIALSPCGRSLPASDRTAEGKHRDTSLRDRQCGDVGYFRILCQDLDLLRIHEIDPFDFGLLPELCGLRAFRPGNGDADEIDSVMPRRVDPGDEILDPRIRVCKFPDLVLPVE